MKVKLFESVVNVSGVARKGFLKLEGAVNEFLLGNPGIRVIDIKLASNAAPVGDQVTNYGLFALIIYEEA